MSANLSGLTSYPHFYRGTAATTWTEIIVPAHCGRVSIRNEDASIALRIAGDANGLPAGTPEVPADGGAVGSHYGTVEAGELVELTRRGVNEPKATGSIFIASASGMPTYQVILEPRP